MRAMQLGPFYLNLNLLVVLVSAAAGYAVIWWVLRRSAWRESPLADMLLNALMLGLAGWKLSPFLLQPALLWTSPLRGIMMLGGVREALIGAIIAIWYLLWSSLVKGLTLRLIADSLAYGAISFWLVQALFGGWRYGKLTSLPWGIPLSDPALRYHPLNLYELAAAALLAGVLLFGRWQLGDGRAGQMGLFGVGAGLFAISLAAMDSPFGGILTGVQWISLLVMGLGLIVPRMYILWEAYQERRGFVLADSDSKAARRQERDNQRRGQTAPEQKGYDKKLDGPNKPST